MLNNDNFLLGNAFCQQGLYDKSLQFYLKAIEEAKLVNTLSYFHYENLAYSYYKIADNTNASEYAKKALELNPNAIISNHILGNYIENEGNREVKYPSDHPVSIVQNAMPESVHNELAKSFESENKLAHEEDSFVLYRVVGNDLYPRHSLGQSRQNVEFILANEPELPSCRKIWIVNRIVNTEERAKVIQLLEKYQQEFLEIPFIEEEYKNIDVDYSTFPEGFFESKNFLKKGPAIKERILTTVYRNKNKYAMHNNGARNFALKHGREVVKAKWVLPWDGNCFVTLEAWNEIVRDIREKQYLSHFVVPMARITSNDLLLLKGFRPDPREEPQLVFRRDTKDAFNDEFCYGRRPKVEMFWFLGIPGLWDTYKDDPWDPPRRELSKEAFQFGVAGWTSRLFSGMGKQEAQNQDGARSRFAARQVAIVTMLDYLDNKFRSSSQLHNGLLPTLANMIGECTESRNAVNPKSKSEHLDEIAVLVNRFDGLGERLKAILNGLVLSKKYSLPFKLIWKEKGGADKQFHAIDKVENVFSREFVDEFVVSEAIEDSLLFDLEGNKFTSKDSLIEKVKENGCRYIVVNQPELRRYFPNMKYKQLFKDIYFGISFSNSCQAAIDAAKNIELGENSVAVHMRGGDIIYGRYRHFMRFQRKVISPCLVYDLATEMTAKGKSVLLFMQDSVLKNCFTDLKGVVIASDFIDDDWGPTEIALFEITLMSRCQTIIAGTSGFANVAAWISGIEITPYSEVYSEDKAFDAINKNLEKLDLDGYYRAFSSYSAYLLGCENRNITQLEKLLNIAANCDPQNGLYDWESLLMYSNKDSLEKAEKLLETVFETYSEKRICDIPLFFTILAEVKNNVKRDLKPLSKLNDTQVGNKFLSILSRLNTSHNIVLENGPNLVNLEGQELEEQELSKVVQDYLK